MTDRYAAAYLRRSSADDSNPGDVSREAQEAAVRALAERDGAGELTYFEDWGLSGDEEKIGKRKGLARMVAAMKRGEISTCYAYAIDRLGRGMETIAQLRRVAKESGTRIITARDGELIDDNIANWSKGTLSAFFAEYELRTAKERNGAAFARRKARGDRMGQPPYGFRIVRDDAGNAAKPIAWEDDPSRPLAPVLDAYSAAGSVLGACKLLNAAGVPNARGGALWQPTSLALILERAGVLPPRGHRRTYSRGSVLAGLVRCHCGRTMTPDLARGGLYCAKGKWQGKSLHGPSWAGGAYVLAAVRAEADRLRIPGDAVELGQVDVDGREGLAERKRRLGLAFALGALDEPTFRAELEALEQIAARIEAVAEIVEGVRLDWRAPVSDVNAALRAVFEAVELGPDMRVAEIKWRVPEWRSA